MIQFKKVKFKNFQSCGNQFIEIDLNRSNATLISGHNGSGKSNILEAITYSCFGKSLKKVVLSDLINSVNKKGLLTEIEFSTNGHDYKIIRGEKPKKLEFYRDNEQLLQEASSRDTQAQIEFVLGFDYKTYCQMIVINKERYVPFMDQTPQIRRKVIEDILDISIISVASDLNKSKIVEIKKQLSTIEYERAKLLERKAGLKRLIDQQNNNISSQKDELTQENEHYESELIKRKEVIDTLTKKLEEFEIDDISELRNKVTRFNNFKAVFDSKISEAQKVINFFDSNDTCPTCTQVIDETYKTNIITEKSSVVEENEKNSQSAKDKIDETKKQINVITEKEKLLQEFKMKLRSKQQDIKTIESQIEKNNKKIVELSHVDTTLDSELLELDKKCKECESSYMDIDDKLQQHTALLDHFKDTGVKSLIVSEYIDFINKKINEYLKAMEFWCTVTLDESFNETIRLGQRDKVSYDSFSTGQKSRLNLAIFLALTEVANIKNSVTSNIMMLDEILENIDKEGVEMIMKLFNNVLVYKNVFVITQRAEEFSEHFRSEIKFKLDDNDFSVMVK